MNWLTPIKPTPQLMPVGRVREHICADDKDNKRAREKALARAKAKAIYEANRGRIRSR